jgi:phosphoglycolate phosphatase-like HAD superfamily hydrolase
MAGMLESWNDGPTKSAITDFVGRVTEEGSPDYVEPAARVAVFDNDGTLWCEKPMPIQLDFTIRRLAEMARDDPSLQDQQPYQAAYQNDLSWMGAAMVRHYHGDDSDLNLLMDVTAAFDTVSVEDYDRLVLSFFGEADHPTLDRPYLTCGYTPMVELLRYLQANSFTNYIASGGDRDFMRPIAGDLYGHQRPVPGIRRRDRLCEHRRATTRPGRLPGRARGEPAAGLDGLHAYGRASESPPHQSVVDLDPRRVLAPSRRQRVVHSWT